MATYTIELSEDADAQLREAVSSGRYPDVAAVIEEALGLLQADEELGDEEKLHRLQQIAREGFEDAEGPDAIVINSREELKAYFDGILKEVIAEENGGRAETAA